MYIWDPQTLIFDRIRDDVNSWSMTGTVVGDPSQGEVDPVSGVNTPPPDPNNFTVSGLSSRYSFTQSGNSFTISTQNPSDLFPIRITYLLTVDPDTIAHVDKWSDLPPESKKIVKLETLEDSPQIVDFSVTADYNGSNTETRNYQLYIIHVYTANKNELQYQVGLRSN